MAFKATGNTVISDVQNGTFSAVTFRNFFAQKTQAQGFNFGYITGGVRQSGANFVISTNIVDRFPFSVETTNAASAGTLIDSSFDIQGHSSSTHGYTSSPNIERFPFAQSTISSSNVGFLSVLRTLLSAQSSTTHGYASGGITQPQPVGTLTNIIDRFPFALSTTNATDVGDLTILASSRTGHSSVTHGYASGGTTSPTVRSLVIERFPFSVSITNATNVGNLTVAKSSQAGQSSGEHGYFGGGFSPATPSITSALDRFPFSTNTTNATNIGNLTVAKSSVTGQSSITHGYASGGLTNPTTAVFVIERFPFAAATTNAVTVGNLASSLGRGRASGQQY